MNQNNLLRGAWIFAVLLAGIFLIPTLRAQPTEQTVRSRFLFIFGTSSEMKSRVEATQKALDTMLATSVSGQLHSGDSIGVWTFNQDLRPGDFPLQSWDPDDAVKIAASIKNFIGEQHYAKSTRFEALQPLLNRVIVNSERLTVVIFCDGETKISGTPFDAGINQAFQDKLGNQKSAHQPFVIVLRSQLGQYVNCSMGFPPQPVTFSGFPPLPEPPPTPKPTNVPPPAPSAPVPVVPSLIIIGKKVESEATQPQTAPTNPPPVNLPPVTNQPPIAPPQAVMLATPTNMPVVASIAPTNAPAASPTNLAVAKIIAPAPANPPAPPPENPSMDSVRKISLIAGAWLLDAIVVLGIVMRLNSHRKDPSLITRSMDNRH
jgi:hypothetical protein